MSFEGKTLYEVLGVPQTATKEEIKRAYKELALVYHPDSNFFSDLVGGNRPTGEAIETFKTITSAYNTLSNEAKRAEYDSSILTSSLPNWETPTTEIDQRSGHPKLRAKVKSFGDVEEGGYEELEEEQWIPEPRKPGLVASFVRGFKSVFFR